MALALNNLTKVDMPLNKETKQTIKKKQLFWYIDGTLTGMNTPAWSGNTLGWSGLASNVNEGVL